MSFLSQGNAGPALYQVKDIPVHVGVCPTSLRVFCGLGKGISTHSLRDSVGGAEGLWGVWSVITSHMVPVEPQGELGLHWWQQVRLVPPGCWTSLYLCYWFCSYFLEPDFLGGSYIGKSSWTRFCWLYLVVSSSSKWSAAHHSAPPAPTPWLSPKKAGAGAPSGVCWGLVHEWREEWAGRLTDRLMSSMVVKKDLNIKVKLLIY